MTIDWFYRRPPAAHSRQGSIGSNHTTCSEDVKSTPSSRRSSNARAGYCQPGIPESLSFERIRDNKPATPCTVRDFMCYLMFIERTAENMQFHMWYRDYCERFANLPDEEKMLSPEYAGDGARENVEGVIESRMGSLRLPRAAGSSMAMVIKEKGVFDVTESDSSQQNLAQKLATGDRENTMGGSSGLFGDEGKNETRMVMKKVGPVPADYKEIAMEAYQGADNTWQPFAIQPFRDEVSQVIALYLTPISSRELNISARDRQQTLHALAQTTHPSAFLPVARAAENLLRQQSHPNFIRWAMQTGNQERFMYAHFICVLGCFSAVLSVILLTVCGANRWWRLLSVFPLFVAVYVITAAYRGLCVVLHVEGHRYQLKPWTALGWFQRGKTRPLTGEVENGGFECEDQRLSKQPWDEDYESDYSSNYGEEMRKINYIRRVFGPTKYTQDPALRDIQDSIVAQSAVFALFVCICFAALFIPLPSGHKF